MISWSGSLLAERGRGGVPQLAQVLSGPAGAGAGVVVERDAGAVVAEAGAAGLGAEVFRPGRPGRGGPPLGEEQRAALAPVDQAGQQPGGADGPVRVLRGPNLRADRRAAPFQVEYLDVQRKDLRGAGSGLVEYPPQRLLSQR